MTDDRTSATTTDHPHEGLSFDEFAAAAPEVASPIREKLTATDLALIGTLRRDGSPRVSPVEVRFLDGRLTLGMMPGSAKLADVRREPRACLLTPVADKDDVGGEGKLFCRIVEVGGEEGERLLRAMVEQLEGASFEDLEGSPVFEVRVTAAAWQHVDGDTWSTRSWRAGEPVRHRRRVGATALPEDVPR